MAREITARDITDAKKRAREQHINDDGTSNADHIFAHIPPMFGADSWHRDAENERKLDYEHLWLSDDKSSLVYMTYVSGKFKCEYIQNRGTAEEEWFKFGERKAAEGWLVTKMLTDGE